MKRKPRRFSSLLIACDSAVWAGISATVRQAFTFGSPSTNDQSSSVERHVQRKRRPRVVDHGLDLAAVPDDPCVAEQPLDVALAEACDRVDVPAGERRSVTLALAQDRRPREAGLRALEVEELEERPLVVNGHAPFLVVVGDVERIVDGYPAAADHQDEATPVDAPLPSARGRRIVELV